MLQLYVSAVLIMISIVSNAQIAERSSDNNGIPVSLTQETGDKLKIAGYGEVHFNKPLNSKTISNAELDVHRMVLLMEYGFNARTRFVTEIEFEHVIEVYVEQAYLQHKINKYMQFRAGLLLVPMGIINGTHEPTSFNGVERPLIDQKISPTTWREVGMGIAGTLLPVKMKYQLYLINGFNGYNGIGKFNGKDGLRSGRQKGAESFMSRPDLATRLEYFGFGGLNIGFSGYFGTSESTLYDEIDKSDNVLVAKADSSAVGISMFGIDAKFNRRAFQGKIQFYYTTLSNTNQYNAFTGIAGTSSALGTSMMGYYVETGYNVFHSLENIKSELIPFVRLEGYDTHLTVSDNESRNENFRTMIITPGLSLKLSPNAVLKTDLQFLKSASTNDFSKILNAGVAVTF